MKLETYQQLKQKVIEAGFSKELDWASSIKPCRSSPHFAYEAIHVIVNSGMKAQIAEKILKRVYQAMEDGTPISEAFGHKGKVKAIEWIIEQHQMAFLRYQTTSDKLAFLEGLPWIGKITKYHLAKNLGHDCIKPDRHLVRIAESYNTEPWAMCLKIKEESGDSLALVDSVVWRAANLKFI